MSQNKSILSWFNNKYEKILHGAGSDEYKGALYANLMTDMESEFKIPMIRDEAWEKENRAVIALYRKISLSRKF